jgi:flavin reductase (DIM6/NTAB) family NADH-FMN oxidoreductase RutF/DNA-binding MarR family transcriptional regulator
LATGVHAVSQPLRADVIEQGDPAADPRAFRRCLGQFATGVGVMTTTWNGELVGVTANSFSSLSMDPPLVLWSIAQTSRRHSAFTGAQHFAVNILSAEQVDISQRFASPLQNKFEGVAWKPGLQGSPLLPHVLASLECELTNTFQGGDHVILVGRVRRYTRYAGNALLYAQGRYAVAEDHPSLQVKPASSSRAAVPNLSDVGFMALIGYVAMYASGAFDKYRQSQGLNLTQSRVMFALSGGSPMSLQDVVVRAVLTRESAEDAIDSLVERKFVQQENERFVLTESGTQLSLSLTEQIARFQAEQLDQIPQQDIAVARTVLERLFVRLNPQSQS